MKPMLACPGHEPFDDPAWCFEVKWDGYRCLAYLDRDNAHLLSRNGKPLLSVFPHLVDLRLALKTRRAIVDGEIVAFRDGKVSFSDLRQNPGSALFVAFDLLWVGDRLITGLPLGERKELLEKSLEPTALLSISETVAERGKAVFRSVVRLGLEGMMAKRMDSPYVPGERSCHWLKIKHSKEDNFWVLGYAASPGRRAGSILVAGRGSKPRDESPKTGVSWDIVGRVSSGLDRTAEEELLKRVRPLPESHLRAFQKMQSCEKALKDLLRGIIPVVPFYGVRVSYTEVTPDGRLRHPVFKGFLDE